VGRRRSSAAVARHFEIVTPAKAGGEGERLRAMARARPNARPWMAGPDDHRSKGFAMDGCDSWAPAFAGVTIRGSFGSRSEPITPVLDSHRHTGR
jgi:hypothetical protein